MRIPWLPCVLALPLLLCAACGNVVVDRDGAGGTGEEPAPPDPCPSGEEEVCYSGPPGTEGTGACAAGARYCDASGGSWSECVGEVVPGAEVCATPEDESCDGVGKCTGAAVWARDLSTDGGDGIANGVTADPWGDVLVTGSFSGAFEVAGLSLSSEGGAGFVAKLDASGKGLWARQTQGPAGGAAVAADADGNVLVTGAFHEKIDLGDGPLTSDGLQDVFVAKYDRSGEILWSRKFGGSGYQWPEDLAIDAQGNVLITGGIHDGADFGDGYEPAVGETDLFVLKLDPSGDRVYSKHFGTKGYDYGLGIAASAGGAAVITGSFAGTLDLGGGALVTAGSDDVFVAWLSPQGEHIWSRRAGSQGHDLGKGIAVGPTGTVVVAGLSTGAIDLGGGLLAGGGGFDAFVAWYSSEGQYLDARLFGAPGATAEALDVAVDGAQHTVVVGNLTGTASLGGAALSASDAGPGAATDLFVAKYGPAGEHVYSYVFGDGEQQLAWAGAVDRAGSALVAGSFRGGMVFGKDALTAPPGASDLFVAKLAP
jgi:hypothetical protein